MTRASLVLSSGRRAPPAKREPPAREIPITPEVARQTIEQAFAELKELDRLMTTIDQELDRQHERLATADEWRVIDIEPKIDQLNDRRSKASFDVLFATNRVIHFGAYLMGEWRETDLDNIARQLSVEDGLFGRVASEWPGMPEHPVWQRVAGEAVPF